MAIDGEASWVIQGNISLSLTPGATCEGPPVPQRLYERGQFIFQKAGIFLSEYGTHISANQMVDESGIETNVQPAAQAGV